MGVGYRDSQSIPNLLGLYAAAVHARSQCVHHHQLAKFIMCYRHDLMVQSLSINAVLLILTFLQAFAMSCKDLCPVLGEDASEEHIVSQELTQYLCTLHTV